MKYSTLKRLSITMYSLIMVLCSEVQSAQDLTDSEIMTPSKTNLLYQNEDTQLRDNELIAPQSIKLEEYSVSWASYLFTPFKTAVNNTYRIINYATQNPQKAMIVGLMLAANITAVAAGCECYCVIHDSYSGKPYKGGESIGMVSDPFKCVKTCIDDYKGFPDRCW